MSDEIRIIGSDLSPSVRKVLAVPGCAARIRAERHATERPRRGMLPT